ncbi:MAG: spermine/spermidine synthase family protein [Bacteroidetes bacterium]|nr:spermine/spermidine synthase family protein [Bacteroidota bacterium]
MYGIIATLFIVSGATGLVYQIAWFKYISLFFGNTTYAQTIVLATFMGGLAIGASLWGRRADRSKSPIRIYGGLELLIGVYCILFPFLLNVAKSAFVFTVHALQLPSDGTAVLFLKFLTSVVLLLFPTILMGGTLPVLVRFISHSVEESGKNVATLYFLNSFGAVMGSLLCGFFLVPMAGLQATVISAGIINIVIAGIAFLLGARTYAELAGGTETVSEPESQPSTDLQVFLAVGVAGFSGLAAMIYEVAWVRLLIHVLGSSTYSYTLMLVAFISGITLGSWLVAVFIGRIRNLFGALALCQLGVGISMALTLPLYGRIPYLFWHLGAILTPSEATYPIFLILQFVICFMIMIIPTIFLGMSLPLASRIATRSVVVLGRTVGTVFTVNTVGTVIGSLAAGLVLMPLIGVRHAMEVGFLLNLGCGIVLMYFDDASSKLRRVVLVAPVAILAYLSFIFGSDWNQSVMFSGVFRQIGNNRTPPASYSEFEKTVTANKVLFYKEGAAATVGVYEHPLGPQLVLLINGKADASSLNDLPTQVLVGQVPMMLHPQPDTVLVVGFGSGVTVGSVLAHPVKYVESAEISPEVIEASRLFEHVNNRPLSDPRLSLHVDDALATLKLTQVKYDVIISQPSNPWRAGVGNLFTTEFFQLCKERLKADGLMVQWLQLYEIDDESFRLVVRTIRTVFPHIMVWQSLAKDVIFVGSTEPIRIDEEKLVQKLTGAAVKADLARIQILDAATLLSLQMISEKPLREYASDGPLNTEDKPLLEHWAPRAFFANRGAGGLDRLDERTVFGKSNLLLDQLLEKRPLTEQERLNIGLFHAALDRGNVSVGHSMLAAYLGAHPRDGRALAGLASLTGRLGRHEERIGYLERLAELTPNDPVLLDELAWTKYSRKRSLASSFISFDAAAAEKLLKRCVELTADTVDYYRVRLGHFYFGIQQYQKAFDSYRKALQIRERYAPDRRVPQDLLLVQLAKCYRELGNSPRAVGYALQAAMMNPKNEEAKNIVYSVWLFGDSNQRDTTQKR